MGSHKELSMFSCFSLLFLQQPPPPPIIYAHTFTHAFEKSWPCQLLGNIEGFIVEKKKHLKNKALNSCSWRALRSFLQLPPASSSSLLGISPHRKKKVISSSVEKLKSLQLSPSNSSQGLRLHSLGVNINLEITAVSSTTVLFQNRAKSFPYFCPQVNFRRF